MGGALRTLAIFFLQRSSNRPLRLRLEIPGNGLKALDFVGIPCQNFEVSLAD